MTRALVAAYGCGGACAAYGGWLLVSTRRLVDVPAALEWLAGVVVAHDALVAPVALLVGVLVARAVPGVARAPVQAGLVVSAAVTAAAAALVLGLGRDPLNPSQLPLPYGRNLLLVLAAVWLVVLLWVVSRLFRGFVGRPQNGGAEVGRDRPRRCPPDLRDTRRPS